MTEITRVWRPPAAAAHLLDELDPLTAELARRILDGEYAYVETTSLTYDELLVACRDNLEGLLRGALAGRAAVDLGTAKAVGRLKASRGVPLPALLHAFRLAGRLLSEEIAARVNESDAMQLPEFSARLWALIDDFSSAAADAYAEEMAQQARAHSEARQLSVRALIWGEALDRQSVKEHLGILGLAEHGAFVVAWGERSEPDATPFERRQHPLLVKGVRSEWILDLRGDVGLIEVGDEANLERVASALVDVSRGRVGLSAPFESLDKAPNALREAELAMRCGAPGSTSVVRYGERPIALLLGRAPDEARAVARAVLGPILDLPEGDRSGLIETLTLWFECDGSAAAVGERQHFHRNTIHQRLRRIEQLTGLTCSKPSEAAELHLALRAVALGYA